MADEIDVTGTSSTAGSAAAGQPDSPPTDPMPGPRDSSYDLTIDVIDMITLEKCKCFARAATQRTPIAIAEGGFLPASPVDPSLAVSFRTLEYFRRLRLRKASYSVEAFAKTVCDLYGVSARTPVRLQ